jgi:hypothetical protein
MQGIGLANPRVNPCSQSQIKSEGIRGRDAVVWDISRPCHPSSLLPKRKKKTSRVIMPSNCGWRNKNGSTSLSGSHSEGGSIRRPHISMPKGRSLQAGQVSQTSWLKRSDWTITRPSRRNTCSGSSSTASPSCTSHKDSLNCPISSDALFFWSIL